MNKWVARFILLFIILYILWLIFKYKNNLNETSFQTSYSKLSNQTHHLIDSVIQYAKNPFEEQRKIQTRHANSNSPSPSKKRWKTEEYCREILQTIYGRPFPSIRPKFLKSPRTKKNLELDCYNEELSIALEYNGKQHYTYCPYFHKTKKSFYAQVHRDNWKRKKCMENNITLIEVPYIVPKEELKQYIINQLKKHNRL